MTNTGPPNAACATPGKANSTNSGHGATGAANNHNGNQYRRAPGGGAQGTPAAALRRATCG